MVVQEGDLNAQARAYAALAALYKETNQLTKAEEFYRRVCNYIINYGISIIVLYLSIYLYIYIIICNHVWQSPRRCGTLLVMKAGAMQQTGVALASYM